jgi:hypothetical protein
MCKKSNGRLGVMVYTQEELISELIPFMERYPVKRAALFGSYARNEQTEGSDVDILFELGTDEKETDTTYIYLLLDEIESKIGARVDFVTVDSLEYSPSKRFVRNLQNDSRWFYTV